MADVAPLVASHLADLLDERRGAGEPVDSEQWYGELVDCATAQMARRRGVCATLLCGGAPGEFGLEKALETWPQAMWDDAHALGWVHEQYAGLERRKSFAGHVHREEKHRSMTVSTQLYTPRWVADFLAEGAFAEVDVATAKVLDPAVGGGQMLLAAVKHFAEAFPEAPQLWAERLWGVDLDPRAVEVAKRGLALEIAGRSGGLKPVVLETLERQLRVGDGLFDEENALKGRRPRFEVVLANPPYMGLRSMPKELKGRLRERYAPYHQDLFSAFIARCHELSSGVVGILAQQAIWYLRRFEKARLDLFQRGALTRVLHLGAGAFWNLSGEKASVIAFVQRAGQDHAKAESGDEQTLIWDLRRLRCPESQEEGYRGAVAPTVFEVASNLRVPGRPLCHDLPGPLRRLFAECSTLGEVAEIPGTQNKTGRNRQYVRRFDEVGEEELRRVEALGNRGSDQGRWVFYSKGGRFAPWWGNWEFVVDWSKEARGFYAQNRTSQLLDERFWFKEGVVYTDFGGARFNARWMPPGCLFDMTGPAIFPGEEVGPELSERERIGVVLALLNSSVARRLLGALNPTLHFQVRDLRALPVVLPEGAMAQEFAARAWGLVEGVRALHEFHDGDPLCSGAAVTAGQADQIARLREEERALDRLVSELYGVSAEPVERATLCDHWVVKRISERSK